MKKLLLVLLIATSLSGCSPEFWAAIESPSPVYSNCSYYDPVYNIMRYYRCNPYYPTGYYYSYPPTYVYRYTPTIIVVDRKDKYKETTQKKHHDKDDKRRTSGVERGTIPPQPNPKPTTNERSPSPRGTTRGDVKSN